MDTQITLRPERRAVPRASILLQQAPLDLAANPALLADLQAAVILAESDPRAVNCLLQGQKLYLGYARYLLQMAEEILAERSSSDSDSSDSSSSLYGNEHCLPAKQDQQ